jgi:cellulose synthase/poly-beta-1,6-N-acetylglucosamine synthase-like glycosyltransferase
MYYILLMFFQFLFRLYGMLLSILSFTYLICALLLALYATSSIFLLLIYWRHRHDVNPIPHIDTWPTVAVQLPIYNERYVIERLLDSVARLDYPRDKLLIQVLDDSTDDTSDVVAAHIATLRENGLNIEHIQRANREGYKAGALAWGLSLIESEFVVVLDADFMPDPDFLRCTIPYLVADGKLGMVQTRWGHLNAYDNVLTLGQTLALDGHFVVEQTARNRAGWLINFNGSGGVWRAACIRQVGGWRDITLTEDLDLSYRAQLAGWHFLYLPDVVVPAELPPQIAAYKQQQARWAKGSTQTLVQIIGSVWQGRLTLGQRIMATLHLCQYIPHPLMIALLFLTPPLMIARGLQGMPLGPLGLAGLGPPLVYLISQRALYADWRQRILAFPVLLVLGTGIAWNNTVAVVEGFLPHRHNEFQRTPKFGKNGQANHYALSFDSAMWIELMLAIYALWGALMALEFNAAYVPYMALYSFAFGVIAVWSLRDRWRLKRSVRK